MKVGKVFFQEIKFLLFQSCKYILCNWTYSGFVYLVDILIQYILSKSYLVIIDVDVVFFWWHTAHNTWLPVSINKIVICLRYNPLIVLPIQKNYYIKTMQVIPGWSYNCTGFLFLSWQIYRILPIGNKWMFIWYKFWRLTLMVVGISSFQNSQICSVTSALEALLRVLFSRMGNWV